MSQMIFKEKKTKYAKQSWLPHQDNSYPKNKNGHYITINIFLDRSTKKNGTLYIFEQSHKYGIFKYKKKLVTEKKILDQVTIFRQKNLKELILSLIKVI